MSLLPICELAATGVAMTISKSATTELSSIISILVVNQPRCGIVLSEANQFTLLNSSGCDESISAAELCGLQRISFRCQIMYLAGNQVFAAELCCPQWIRCSLLNFVFCSESGVRCRIMLSAVNQVFAAKFVLSVVNQLFVAELCIASGIRCSPPNCVVLSESSFRCWICVVRSKSGVRCQICVFRSESGVRCRVVYFAANQVFTVDLCCP